MTVAKSNFLTNLIVKKNQENTSKHGDACGIYARICLRSCESELSPPSPSSLCVIASDTALLLYNKYTLSTVSKF